MGIGIKTKHGLYMQVYLKSSSQLYLQYMPLEVGQGKEVAVRDFAIF